MSFNMASRSLQLLFFSVLVLCIAAVAKKKAVPKPKQPKQLFAHSSEWNVCLSFIQNGTNAGVFGFPTRAECERTVVMMDNGCVGPTEFVPPQSKNGRPLFRTSDCSNVLCPDTHFCKKGLSINCCNKAFEKMLKAAESARCPNGSKAAGVGKGKDFKATFAKDCDDLICGKKEKCQQISDHFAKCCQTK
uniref:DB domain-containing protein n=1 Tax=Steinernema glaseri TaxID=37863 RepID=A0A1I8ASF4_9BILA